MSETVQNPNAVDALKKFFDRRWRVDIAKLYLVGAVALALPAGRAWHYSFDAPPRSELHNVTGLLSIEKRYRGFVVTVTPKGGIGHTFTCYTGSDVYCADPKIPAGTQNVTARFAKERPELLLELSNSQRVSVPYEKLAARYRFDGHHTFVLGVVALLFALFILTPYIHRQENERI